MHRDDIEQGEVLWIRPDVCCLPEMPDGFAFRVDEFLGWDYRCGDRHRVWVRGPVVLDAQGAVLRTLTLSVPVDQTRAVLAIRVSDPGTPPQAARPSTTRAGEAAWPGIAAHTASASDPGELPASVPAYVVGYRLGGAGRRRQQQYVGYER